MSGALRSISALVVVLALGSAARAAAQDEPVDTVTAEATVTEAAITTDASVDAEASVGDGETTQSSSDELARQLSARQDFAAIHRAFGIATWASMAVTAVFGWIQFADEYGFHGSENETACSNGTAVFQDFCTGVPWAHAIGGFTTAALYFTTAGLSLAMPAPLESTPDLEIHKTLRWIHLATMLATAVFGVVTANVDADFGTRQALALVHQGLGVTTFGLLTAAAAVIVF